MSWPQEIKPEETSDQTVSSLDIAATFYTLAGGEVNDEEFTGVNLMPFIKDETIGTPHTDLKWKFTISRAIRSGDWKLVSIPDRLPMLYHLPTDTSELNDVSYDNLEITKRLLKQLGEWDVELPHSSVLEEPIWKKRQLSLYDLEYQLKQQK